MTRSLWLGAAVAVGMAIAGLPAVGGLSRPGQLVLAITALCVVLWMSRALNAGVVSVLMMGLMVVSGVRPPLVLSGFANPGYWILLCVLFYGFAMDRTGLARRLAYYILSLFPGTYTGILSAFLVLGSILAMGIPSMTVRTAIMVPVAWALVQSLKLPAHSRGAALIILTTVEMAMVPGCGVLYGSLMGPIVEGLFRGKHFELSWLGYAQVVGPPTLLLCVLIVAVNQLLLKPEFALHAGRGFAREQLAALGPPSRQEWLTALVVMASIVFWATDRAHHLPSFLAGMFGLVVFALAGIVRDPDIGGGISWTLLLFMGGIFSLANVLQEYKITDWLAGYLVPVARQLTHSPVALVIVLAVATYAMRFIDPSSLIAMPLLFLPISDTVIAAGIPPLVAMAPLVIASVPFWLSYQNIWVAMAEGLTDGKAFTARQRLVFATAYAVLALAALAAGVAYWKWTGVMGTS